MDKPINHSGRTLEDIENEKTNEPAQKK